MIPHRGALARVAGPVLLAACACAGPAAARELTITMDKLEAPGASVQGLRAVFTGDALDALAAEAGAVSAGGKSVKKARVTCPKLELTA